MTKKNKYEWTVIWTGFVVGILTFLYLCFVFMPWEWNRADCAEAFDPYKEGSQCVLYTFEDQYEVYRSDIAPYTNCKCSVNIDNGVTTACCCTPD